MILGFEVEQYSLQLCLGFDILWQTYLKGITYRRDALFYLAWWLRSPDCLLRTLFKLWISSFNYWDSLMRCHTLFSKLLPIIMTAARSTLCWPDSWCVKHCRSIEPKDGSLHFWFPPSLTMTLWLFLSGTGWSEDLARTVSLLLSSFQSK